MWILDIKSSFRRTVYSPRRRGTLQLLGTKTELAVMVSDIADQIASIPQFGPVPQTRQKAKRMAVMHREDNAENAW